MAWLLEKLLTSTLAGGLIVALASSSCREHEDLCGGASCLSSSGQAQGGADAGPEARGGNGGAGEGGAGGIGGPSAITGCQADSDCSDDVYCNGLESCAEGQCTPGAEPDCAAGTSCVEGATEAQCHFPNPSPWLVVASGGSLQGLPAAQLGQQNLLTLAEKDAASVFSGFVFQDFSGDGRRVWLHFYHGAFRDVSMFEVTLGPGLPGPLTPVRDLPTVGSFLDTVFSADSRHAYIEDEFSGLYLFDFDPEDPSRHRGRLLGEYEYEWYFEPGFCKDSDLLIVTGNVATAPGAELPPSSAWLVDVGDGELKKTEIGEGAASVAEDGSLFTLTGSDRVDLFACDRALPRAELAQGAWSGVTFMGNGAYVALEHEREHRIFSVVRPSRPVLVYSCSDCDVTWMSDSPPLIQVGSEDDLLELRGDAPPVPYDGETLESLLGAELAERVQAQGSGKFLVQGAERNIGVDGMAGAAGAAGAAADDVAGSPKSSEFGIVVREYPDLIQPIVREGSGYAEGNLQWSDMDLGLAVVERDDGGSTQVWLLRFAEAPFTEELIASDVGIAYVAVSPDNSGFAYSFLDRGEAKFSEVHWRPFAADRSTPLGVAGEPVFGPRPP